jgi:hypothetical protein
MDDKARLQLQQMIKANNVEDVTDLIRELKHSHKLQADINALLKLMNQYKGDDEKIHDEGVNACPFLFTYYTDIYNKIRKNEIDLGILNQFLNVLRQIEDGEFDQHEGAFVIGTLLKELYVDSALKKADKLNQDEPVIERREPVANISWKTFKKLG